MRSYHPEYSRTHQNMGVFFYNPDWACLVLTWVTRGESRAIREMAVRGSTGKRRPLMGTSDMLHGQDHTLKNVENWSDH